MWLWTRIIFYVHMYFRCLCIYARGLCVNWNKFSVRMKQSHPQSALLKAFSRSSGACFSVFQLNLSTLNTEKTPEFFSHNNKMRWWNSTSKPGTWQWNGTKSNETKPKWNKSNTCTVLDKPIDTTVKKLSQGYADIISVLYHVFSSPRCFYTLERVNILYHLIKIFIEYYSA